MKQRLIYAAIVLAAAGIMLGLYLHKVNAPLVTLPLGGAARGVDFSPDGKTISVCTNTGVVLYDTARWKQGLLLKGHTDASYWMPGSRLLTFGRFEVGYRTPQYHSGTEMTLWNTLTGAAVGRTALPAYEVAALSPDRDMAALSFKGGTKIVSTTTGQFLHGFPGPPFFEPQFSPDGRYFANVARVMHLNESAPVHVWDTRTWREVPGPLVQRMRGDCLQYSPDGRTLATGTLTSVTLWDTRTWRTKSTFPARFKYLFRLRFSPDGKRLAGGGRFQGETNTTTPDIFWTLWNVSDGRRRAEIHNAYFWEFLPGGEVALTEDPKETRLFSGETGKLLWSSAGRVPHADGWMEQTRVALSPDNKTLATATDYRLSGGAMPAEIGHPASLLQIWNMPQR